MFKSAQLRQLYLDFFKNKRHAVLPSASLVPENDPTTLFTGSGMQPLLPFFLGRKHPMGQRVTNSQRCFRSQDIEEVGDNRHTTFFEMLGNWSFGDYFKGEQLAWFFEFLTQVVGLEPHKLYVSAYRGDKKIGVPKDAETPSIWQKLFTQVEVEAQIVEEPIKQGLVGRIFYYGDKNWWSRSGSPEAMPAGEPGGPDSEVFYDFGPELGLHQASVYKNQPCHPNCDCGRFLEIGNSVFMQYQKTAEGKFIELEAKNVDFGGGLERILAAANHNHDVFQTDLFSPLALALTEITGKSYQDNQKAFRVIMDHVKAAFMLAADGVYPGNKEQGYFSRRLLRRSIRYGKMLGINQPFLAKILPAIVDIYRPIYPQLQAKSTEISQIFVNEEEKFTQTLNKGLKEIAKLNLLDGAVAFKLYETYGFPLELTEEIAQERGQKIDHKSFKQAFDEHKNQSRAGSAQKFKGGLADSSAITTRYHTATHLLQAALRLVLGEKVQQKGSHITKERARFDFSFDRALTMEEIKQIETRINFWINQALVVEKEVMAKAQALDSGAIAFFGERYPDKVTVYTIGQTGKTWVSKELCGGPHVENCREIGSIKIVKEQSSGAQVRRIYLTFVE